MMLKDLKTIPLTGLLVMMMASLTSVAAPEQALVPGGVAITGLKNYTLETRITFDNRKTTIFKHDDA